MSLSQTWEMSESLKVQLREAACWWHGSKQDSWHQKVEPQHYRCASK